MTSSNAAASGCRLFDSARIGALFLLGIIASYSAEASADQLGEGAEAAASGDRSTAIKLLRPLAEHGIGKAAWILGDVYADGLGAPKDTRLAIKWYRVAIISGDLEGYNRIAGLYRLGDGVRKDPREAIKWYRASARRGNSYGQFNLGIMYSDDRNGVADYVKAYAWLTIADAHKVDAPPGWTPGAFRDRLAVKMTAGQIEEAQERVKRWMDHGELP